MYNYDMPNNPSINTNFYLDVAKGKVPGHTFIRKFGSIAAVATSTPTDVWEYGITSGAEKYTFSTTADIDTMSSSNGTDDEVITIEGLDGDYVLVIQSKALDGQNKVTLDTPLMRVNRVYNSNGTSTLGNVYVYVDGTISTGVPTDVTTVRGYFSIAKQQTLQCIYTVPAGLTAYVMEYQASITKGGSATAKNADMSGNIREVGKVFRVQDEFSLNSTGSSYKSAVFPLPLPFPEKTDFVCTVDDVSAEIGASWSLTIMLVDNNYLT
jgi:hypothetical protein